MDQSLQLPCVWHSSQPLTHGPVATAALCVTLQSAFNTHTDQSLQLPFVGHPSQPLIHGPVTTAAMCGSPQSAFNTWTSDYSCPGFQHVTALKFTVLSSDYICVAYHAKIFIFVAFPLMPVRVTLGFPGLCCCVCITSCKHHYLPLHVKSIANLSSFFSVSCLLCTVNKQLWK